MLKKIIVVVSWLLFFFLATWLPFTVTSNQYSDYVLMLITLTIGTIVGIILTVRFLNKR